MATTCFVRVWLFFFGYLVYYRVFILVSSLTRLSGKFEKNTCWPPPSPVINTMELYPPAFLSSSTILVVETTTTATTFKWESVYRLNTYVVRSLVLCSTLERFV